MPCLDAEPIGGADRERPLIGSTIPPPTISQKLARAIESCLGSSMFHHRAPDRLAVDPDRALDLRPGDTAWLALRHPAVLRLLERELAARGPALAAGLELACRVLGGRGPLGDLRLDHNTLNTGMVTVRSGRCDRAMVRSIRDQIAELRVVLTAGEQDAVATVIAAIIWAVLDASTRALDALVS
jgi:hypothetical protein